MGGSLLSGDDRRTLWANFNRQACRLWAYPLYGSPRYFSMYDGWNLVRWDTELSDLESLVMVSLVDDGCLRITLENPRDPERPRWCVEFDDAPIYQNIVEEYRLELWSRAAERVGWTAVIPDSPWLRNLSERESLIALHSPGLAHYQIGTEDDVVDILSASEPRIRSVGSGSKR